MQWGTWKGNATWVFYVNFFRILVGFACIETWHLYSHHQVWYCFPFCWDRDPETSAILKDLWGQKWLKAVLSPCCQKGWPLNTWPKCESGKQKNKEFNKETTLNSVVKQIQGKGVILNLVVLIVHTPCDRDSITPWCMPRLTIHNIVKDFFDLMETRRANFREDKRS